MLDAIPLRHEYYYTALSTLPEGDERGQPPPGMEAWMWPHSEVGFFPIPRSMTP